MKARLVGLCIALGISLPLFAAAGVSGVSFGGRVTFEYYCNSGILAYIKSSSPPYLTLPIMWYWGELPYSSYIPPHPGQLLLGIITPATVPCIVGYYPIGYGFPIQFHGSSI
jgi:hypothetical protein